MKCRDYERQVLPFLHEELTDIESKEFIRHVRQCTRCYEELEIYYSIYGGLQMMQGNTWEEYYKEAGDLKSKVDIYLDQRYLLLHRKKQFRILKNIIKIILIAFLLAVLGLQIYLHYQQYKG